MHKKTTKNEDDAVFVTEKFYFSALLMALGYNLIRMDKVGDKKVNFVFALDKDVATEILNAFYEKQISVNAAVFVDKIKELKDRMYGVIL